MLKVKTTSNSTKGYYKIINVEGSWLELSPEQSAEIREIRNEARQLRDGKGLDLNPDAGEQEVDKAIAAYKEKTKTEKVSVTDIKAVKEKIKGAAKDEDFALHVHHFYENIMQVYQKMVKRGVPADEIEAVFNYSRDVIKAVAEGKNVKKVKGPASGMSFLAKLKNPQKAASLRNEGESVLWLSQKLDSEYAAELVKHLPEKPESKETIENKKGVENFLYIKWVAAQKKRLSAQEEMIPLLLKQERYESITTALEQAKEKHLAQAAQAQENKKQKAKQAARNRLAKRGLISEETRKTGKVRLEGEAPGLEEKVVQKLALDKKKKSL